jgi:hypothetical protein
VAKEGGLVAKEGDRWLNWKGDGWLNWKGDGWLNW